MKRLSLLVVTILLIAAAPSMAQTTYTWIGGNGAWTTTTNWLPTRTTPATNDILLFNNGATDTVGSVPAQTIGQLVVSYNTAVNLQAGGANILKIGSNLSIASGCQLNFIGATALTCSLTTAATGYCAGSMLLTGAAHSFKPTTAYSDTFAAGSTLTQGLLCTGNVFGNAGNANVVVFMSGSTFISQAGSNPFGLGQPNSRVAFQGGSWLSHQQSGSPAFSGRTYANFELNYNGTIAAAAGGNPWTLDSLKITKGYIPFQLTRINLKGSITVAVSESLKFNPTASCSLKLNGTSAQYINAGGLLSLNNFVNLYLSNASGVMLQHDVANFGSMNVNSGLLDCGASVISGTGAFTLASGATIGSGHASGLNGNVTVSGTKTYNTGANYLYNGVVSQFTGTDLPATVNDLTFSNGMGVTMTTGTMVNGALTLTNGNVAIGANTLTINGTLTALAGVLNGGASSNLSVTGSGANVTIPALTLNNLAIDRAAGVTLGGTISVGNRLTLTNGLLNNTTNNISLAMDWDIYRYHGSLSVTPVYDVYAHVYYFGDYDVTVGPEIPTATPITSISLEKGSHGLILDRPIAATMLHMTNGYIHANSTADTLYIPSDSPVDYAGGWVDAPMSMHVATGAVTKTFPVGTANGYSPVTVAFNNVGTAGMLTAAVTQASQPNVLVADSTLQRYWTLTKDGTLGFDNYSATLNYRSSDFTAQFPEDPDENTMIIGKHDAGGWTFPAIGTRTPGGVADGGSIQLTGLTGFSDFTTGKDANAFALPPDADTPHVVATVPANGATRVNLNDAIRVAFNEPVNTGTLFYHTTPSMGGESVGWSAAYDTAIIVHDYLTLGTTYTVTVDSVRDADRGTAMASPYSFSFTAIADTMRPYVVSSLPAEGAVKVALDAPLRVAFSEYIDPATLHFSFPMPLDDTTWSAAGDTLTLGHTTLLVLGTGYQLNIWEAHDSVGNFLVGTSSKAPSGYLINFTTTADTTKPVILSTTPVNGAPGVALNAPVMIAYSKAMDTLSLVGTIDPPLGGMSASWSATRDTQYLAHDPFAYNTTYKLHTTAGSDTFGNALAVLPDSLMFTTIPNQGPQIVMVSRPGDTYDGTGPFTVTAVITDPAKKGSSGHSKQGIAGASLYYSTGAAWFPVSGLAGAADTFSFAIPGGFVAGDLVSYYLYAADDAGANTSSPANAPIGTYQFRVLNPLPPTGLSATSGVDMAVPLTWAPPSEELGYCGSPYYDVDISATDIVTTRFTPMHYPCKLEQALSLWVNATGIDSVIVHVYADDGTGMPNEAAELVTPFKIMPQSYPAATIVDLSGFNLVLASGDFHVGYEMVTSGAPHFICDSSPQIAIRSLYRSSGIWYGDFPFNWIQAAFVSYSSYSKGLALKKAHLGRGQKPHYAMHNSLALKTEPIKHQQAIVYPKLTGVAALAKNIGGYEVLRGPTGGPYASIGTANTTSYMDHAVQNGNTYYYVVRANYTTPDTFSGYCTEASATPSAKPILLVDDDGSDVDANPDVRGIYTAALDSAGQAGNYTVYNSDHNGAGPDSVWLLNRAQVIWFTGLSGDGNDSTLTPTNEANLKTYLGHGGKLFLCADDYTYQMYGGEYKFSAGQFPYDYLGVDSTTDHSSSAPYNIAGVGYALTDGMTFTVGTTPTQPYPDDMVKVPAAMYDFDVTAKVGEKQAIQYSNGTFRTVFFAFPFENIADSTAPNTKGQLMARILSWLTTGVEGKPAATAGLPVVYSLAANYPNPVNGSTTVKFSLPEAGRVNVAVYTVMGQKVKTLVDGSMNAGYHSVNWNGRNEGGQAVAAGVYMYQMQSEGFSATRKMVVIR